MKSIKTKRGGSYEKMEMDFYFIGNARDGCLCTLHLLHIREFFKKGNIPIGSQPKADRKRISQIHIERGFQKVLSIQW